MTGMFVALEGPDASGKSTQARLLAARIAAAGHTVICTRQPGGTTLGLELRRILLGHSDIDPTAEAFLFAADKAQHVRDLIRPALDGGAVVITDRYVDSAVAYQGYGRRLGADFIRMINEAATRHLRPDVTIVLDVPVDVTYARLAASGQHLDRIESSGREFAERLRAGLLQIAAENPTTHVVLDATADEATLADVLADTVLARLAAVPVHV